MIITLPVSIETERIRIRLFSKKDELHFINFMIDAEATKYLLFTDQQTTKKGAKQLLEETICSYSTSNPLYAFVVADRERDEFLGSVGIMPTSSSSCEIYWSIKRLLWNNGLGTEATKALIHYLANHTYIKSITAHTHPDNIASSKVAEKCGFIYCGIVSHPITQENAKKYILDIS